MRSMVVGLLLGAIGSSGGNISSGSSGSGLGRGGRCDYERGNGLYWSTYGGPVQRSVVTPSSIKLIDDVLAFDYVAGIAHYQNWSTLEPNVVRSCACLRASVRLALAAPLGAPNLSRFLRVAPPPPPPRRPICYNKATTSSARAFRPQARSHRPSLRRRSP